MPFALHRYYQLAVIGFVLSGCGGGGGGGGGSTPPPAPVVPALQISGTQVSEGDSGTTNLTLIATLDRATTGVITVDYATLDGSAVAGSDYTATSGTLTLPAGTTTASITIPVLGDATPEGNESFSVQLSNVSGANLAQATLVATIVDDDIPTISITPAGVFAEGDSGSGSMNFTVTLTPPPGETIRLHYATSDGTAVAGSDYQADSGTLDFFSGQVSAVLAVKVNGDTTIEPDEEFSLTLQLNSPGGSILATNSVSGTIANDDFPALSIVGGSVAEGADGTTSLPFTLSLSQAVTNAVSVDYTTADVTATSGSDYTAMTGTLTFSAGQQTLELPVEVRGDTLVEPDERVRVVLSNVSGATLATSSADGTITNDDYPAISIGDSRVDEGDSGTTVITIPVSLDQAPIEQVSVQYATSDGSATAGSDYTTKTGTLYFSAGQVSASVSVSAMADTAIELDESFTVTLSNPNGATLADDTAVVTLVNDDYPTLSVSDSAIEEGDSGTTNIIFTLTLSEQANGEVTVDYATSDNTATAGDDYTAAAGTLTIPAGDPAAAPSVSIPVYGDLLSEGDETFTLTLSNLSANAIFSSSANATGTIINDDGTQGRLNDTGTTWGLDTSSTSIIACSDSAAHGQDCRYGRDQTDNNDADGHAGFRWRKLDANGAPLPVDATAWSCVQDKVTSLVWEVKTTDGGLHDKGWTYTWFNPDTTRNGGFSGYARASEFDNTAVDNTCHGYDAANPASYCNTLAYVARVNAANLCGASDWRLPSLEELSGLVDFSGVNPAIDRAFFPILVNADNWYWLETPLSNGTTLLAWLTDFTDGRVSTIEKGHPSFVRLVRGGQ